VTEEWLFRGLLFRRVSMRSGRALAYGISALAFAAIHDNPAGFVVYLWLGVVFAAVLERTGRLWAAVAVHMGNNAYVLAMLFSGVAAGT
jgi:membrane protease YdiL (CAAX protease family)